MLFVDQRLDIELARPGDGVADRRALPAIILRQHVEGAEQIDAGVGIGHAPQRGFGDAGVGGLRRGGAACGRGHAERGEAPLDPVRHAHRASFKLQFGSDVGTPSLNVHLPGPCRLGPHPPKPLPMTTPLSFQQLILTLHHYWSERGCLILQPYDMEMGAGTFHPATVLRALGPDPWKCAYVQPCRRPTDGRYGENPNRLGAYYQYQVMLKPSPADLQALYLGSLDAIGIDPLKHDIRFVEDDWESPTLGAWGLGWEVWCDGMEVTQFTYFQQVGGYDCKPVAGELTYGLERLAMYIQGVDNVFDLKFNDEGVTYGEVFLDNEKQMSAYHFEVANSEALFELFKMAAAEADNCLAAKLPIAAYEQAIKASHIFNTLQARGVISVAERQAYIGRVRDLAKGACAAWMDAKGWAA